MKKNDFQLRPVAESDLKQVFLWRNSDRVRQNMFESELIPWENHLNWFGNLHGNPYNKALMFEFRREILGVICAKVVDPDEKRWIWGCYLGDKNIFPGAGTIMGLLALEYLFESLCVNELIGEMLSANHTSEKFNARIGFKTISHFIKTTSSGRQVSATLLKQTRQEWLQIKPSLLVKYLDVDLSMR